MSNGLENWNLCIIARREEHDHTITEEIVRERSIQTAIIPRRPATVYTFTM